MVYLYRRLHYHCECQQLYNHYSTQRKEIVRMERPEFSEIKDYDEFCKYYWYREELIKICKEHGIKASGSKIELNNVIKAYFSGDMILPEKRKSDRSKTTIKELTLSTGLVPAIQDKKAMEGIDRVAKFLNSER